MPVLIVIPARYASTRYPGKPLVDLTGAGGVARSLIERSWRAACEVQGVDRVVVATDDVLIQTKAEAFGAEVVMTSENCANGTERCAEAHAALGGAAVAAAPVDRDAAADRRDRRGLLRAQGPGARRRALFSTRLSRGW